MYELLTRIFGWKILLLITDPYVFDRWTYIKKRLIKGPYRTLDAGCGYGPFTFYASKIGNEAIGVSFDGEKNKIVERLSKICKVKNIQIVTVDLRKLDTYFDKLGKFDQIICFETIQYLLDDDKLICDLANILKPKGRIYLTSPFKYYRRLPGDRVSEKEGEYHVRWGYTHQEIKDLFSKDGIRIIEESFISGVISQ